jgi:hypothetical protein
MLKNSYKLTCTFCQVFLLLLIGVFIIVKGSSMTGWGYIPVEFFLIQGVIVLFIAILSLYQFCPPARTGRKKVLRIAAMVVLLCLITFLAIMVTTVVHLYLPTAMILYLIIFLGIFIWSAGNTFWGVYRKKF